MKGKSMRSSIILLLFVGFSIPIYADESGSETHVEQRLLEIRLASYLTAYEMAMAKRCAVEFQIVQTVDEATLDEMNALRDRLSVHLKKLEKQTRGIGKQLARLTSSESKIRANAIDDLGQTSMTVSEVRVENQLQKMNSTIDFPTHSMQNTSRELDVAIDGPGYLAVVDADRNAIAYTRFGGLNMNASGSLVVGSGSTGLQLAPRIIIPKNATHLIVSNNGLVSCRTPGDVNLQRLGQLRLAIFERPLGLRQIREGLFADSEASGPAKLVIPGENNSGTLRQNWLEVSDSDRIRELIELLISYLSNSHPPVDSANQP